MSATMEKILIDDRQVWCVCWQSSNRRASSYWYFEREHEASIAHQRLLNWETGNVIPHGEGQRRD
ncbi:MAG TPA: hypothetical protein VF201_08885 [Nitrolancea sp.]